MKLNFDFNDKDVMDALDKIPPELREKGLKKGLYYIGVDLTRYIQQTHLCGGTTVDKLAVRTGQLMRTSRPIPPTVDKEDVTGGTVFGVDYAWVHIGEKGQVTIIRAPTHAKYTKGGAPSTPQTIGSRVIEIQTRIHPEEIFIKRKANIIDTMILGINRTIE